MTCDPNQGGAQTTAQWFNTSCFQRRTVAQTVNPTTQGRNEVRGPGFARTDLSIFKNIDLPGAHRVQLRIEGFNVFNQTRFGQPVNSIAATNFGQITTAEDGRIIQLAIKYSF